MFVKIKKKYMIISRPYLTIENFCFAFLCLVALFSYCDFMTDSYIVPRQLFTFAALLLWFSVVAVKVLFNKKIELKAYDISVVITAVCCIESVYAIFQYCVLRYFNLDLLVVGSFENPVGLMSALCLAIPFALYALVNTKQYKRTVFIAIVLILLGILTTESRTGLITAFIILFLFFFKNTKVSKTKITILCVGSFMLLLLGLYYINQSSVSGRLLIWRASIPLITDTPFCGYGVGSFGRLYMNAQAEYLTNFPHDSEYAMLATNSIVPFNEFVKFYLNFGLLGVVISSCFIVLIIKTWKYNKDSFSFYAVLALIALSFISLTSYPFTYPFSYVILIVSILFMIRGYVKHISTNVVNRISAAFVLVMSLSCLYYIIDVTDSELRWGKAYRSGDLVSYSHLRSQLVSNPHFLYSYAVEAFNQEDYNLSLDLATQCSKLLSHYDLELLLGDISLKKKDYAMAISHYQTAANMVPCRFIPLYGLYNVYAEKEDEEMAMEIAKTIVDKPIKVKSQTVALIKNKMNKILSNKK